MTVRIQPYRLPTALLVPIRGVVVVRSAEDLVRVRADVAAQSVSARAHEGDAP